MTPTASILLASALSLAAAPGAFPPRPGLPAPPSWSDRDGPWPSAGRTVFRIADANAAAAAGLHATGLAGWYWLPDRELEASTPRAAEALRLAEYRARGLVDRLGGLAWPDRALLVGFRPEAPAGERDAASRRAGGRVRRFVHLPDLVLVELDVASGDDVLARVAAVSGLPGVAFAEPDLSVSGRPGSVPTDPLFPASWAHRNTGQDGGLAGFDLRSTVAWDLGSGAPSVPVLVIDTGVQPDHPDLLVLPGRDFTTGATGGVPGGEPTNQYENHGTAVAGCISGRVDNGIGTCGMAPACPSVSARCFVATSASAWQANYSWTAAALDWALASGIRITNNSNRYGGTSAAVEAAYAASRAAGAIHFASAGNSGNTGVTYPASLPSVLAIGAADRTGSRASFSCYGPLLDCMAPGASILCTDRTGSAGYGSGDHATVSGTSFASPLAAGVAALMRSRDPGLSPDALAAVLFATARDMGAPGQDPGTGWGLIDAAAAVAAVVPACPADLDRSAAVDGGDLARLLAGWGAPGAADLDGSGSVGGADLALLLSAWGPCR